MDFAHNLKAIRIRRGLSQEALAHLCGRSGQSWVANFEARARQPNLDDLMLLAKHLHSSVNELLGLDEGQSDWENILGYAQAAGLGDGVEAEEYAETHKLKFRAESLARKRLHARSLAVIYGKGDSMLPRLHSGDAILFDQSDTRPADERLFVIQCQGVAGSEYSVKRCREFGDDVYFDALNPEGDHNWRKPRKMTDARNPIAIIGRVRWIGSWED